MWILLIHFPENSLSDIIIARTAVPKYLLPTCTAYDHVVSTQLLTSPSTAEKVSPGDFFIVSSFQYYSRSASIQVILTNKIAEETGKDADLLLTFCSSLLKLLGSPHTCVILMMKTFSENITRASSPWSQSSHINFCSAGLTEFYSRGRRRYEWKTNCGQAPLDKEN